MGQRRRRAEASSTPLRPPAHREPRRQAIRKSVAATVLRVRDYIPHALHTSGGPLGRAPSFDSPIQPTTQARNPERLIRAMVNIRLTKRP